MVRRAGEDLGALAATRVVAATTERVAALGEALPGDAAHAPTSYSCIHTTTSPSLAPGPLSPRGQIPSMLEARDAEMVSPLRLALPSRPLQRPRMFGA
jgi:hypothetical protein